MTKRFLISTLVYVFMLTGLLATRIQAFDVLLEEDFVQKKVLKEQLIKTAD